MADENVATRRRRSRSSSGNENGSGSERESTKRTVLRRASVLVLPEGFDASKLTGSEKDAAEALATLGKGGSRTRGKVGEAWVVLGEASGSDVRAIEAYAGQNGSPDAIPGTYKAVPSRSFKGGMIYEKPPEPKVERKRLED